jgi:localization factor PodJL
MTAGAPQRSGNLEPFSRDIAEDLARRSGLSLNEWVGRLMADGPEDATTQDYFTEPATPAYQTPTPPGDEVGRVTQAIERLSDRIESAENRQALAVTEVERSVREVIQRIEAAEREQIDVSARFEGAVNDVSAAAARLAERLQRIEDESIGPKSTDALKALEDAVGRVGEHVIDADQRSRETLGHLKDAYGALDARLSLAEQGDPERIEKLAEGLTARMDAAHAELGRDLAQAADARFQRVEQAIAKMNEQVRVSEQRSAAALERMGREVLEVAQALSRRVQGVERRSDATAERMANDTTRIVTALEDRLARADAVQAHALEQLGVKIGRITTKLAERIAATERRTAYAIDDVGEQVARVTERIGQRHMQSVSELTERIKNSEERTARLLGEARARIDERLAESQRRRLDSPDWAVGFGQPAPA